MAREINRLSARKVQALSEPGRHADGRRPLPRDRAQRIEALGYALPHAGRRARWGRLGERDLAGPGARARRGRPDADRRGHRPDRSQDSGGRPPPPPAPVRSPKWPRHTWRSGKDLGNATHRTQWRQTLEVQARACGACPWPTSAPTTCSRCSGPCGHEKAETAPDPRRHRCVCWTRPASVATGPARIRPAGAATSTCCCPESRKLTRGHHKAMPYAEVPSFYAAVSAGRTSLFLARAALHDSDGRPVRRDPRTDLGEVDMAAALWTVPAERMKAGRLHRVPLSAPALAILASVRARRRWAFGSRLPLTGGYAALGHGPGPCSCAGRPQRVHRTTDSDHRSGTGVTEETDFPGELAEVALAHLVGDETERAYRRGDALEKRPSLDGRLGGLRGGPTRPRRRERAPARNEGSGSRPRASGPRSGRRRSFGNIVERLTPSTAAASFGLYARGWVISPWRTPPDLNSRSAAAKLRYVAVRRVCSKARSFDGCLTASFSVCSAAPFEDPGD